MCTRSCAFKTSRESSCLRKQTFDIIAKAFSSPLIPEEGVEGVGEQVDTFLHQYTCRGRARHSYSSWKTECERASHWAHPGANRLTESMDKNRAARQTRASMDIFMTADIRTARLSTAEVTRCAESDRYTRFCTDTAHVQGHGAQGFACKSFFASNFLASPDGQVTVGSRLLLRLQTEGRLWDVTRTLGACSR